MPDGDFLGAFEGERDLAVGPAGCQDQCQARESPAFEDLHRLLSLDETVRIHAKSVRAHYTRCAGTPQKPANCPPARRLEVEIGLIGGSVRNSGRSTPASWRAGEIIARSGIRKG